MRSIIKRNKILFVLAVFILQGCVERQDIIFAPPEGFSSTILYGSIFGELKKSDSPFMITDNIIVDSLKYLIIQPGVEIYFPEGKNLTVYGNLVIAGNNESPVLLTSARKDGSWAGIKIINSDNSSFNFCQINKIENDQDTSSNLSAIIIINSKVNITNCIFSNNKGLSGGAIYTDSSTVDVTNSIFSNNYVVYFGGAIFSEYSAITVTNNTFCKNTAANFGGGIVLSNNIISNIQNNIFDGNTNRVGIPAISIMAGDSAKINSRYNFLSVTSLTLHFITNSDFHLSEDSPCKNTGNPDNIFNDFDGTRNDQGAFGGPLGNW